MSGKSELQKKDEQYVWHPFTHLKYAELPLSILKSEGTYYFDEAGNKYIDAISSWWVNLHGHSNPYIAEKVYAQLKTNAHSIFSGFTHPGAIELSERLLRHLPSNFSKVFFSDDGSTSVEVALKMTLQYWSNKNESRTKIIAFEDAYHGDTFGSMSVGARNVFTNAFSPFLFDVLRLPLPDISNFEDVKSTLEKFCKTGNVAAFIFEPLVLGAGGMKMYEQRYLDELIAVCEKNKTICIADEVMTGFGRTGKFFASDYLINKPDIICLSKGITGGVMPLGVTVCSQFIYDAYVSDDKNKTFFHGHSYTANPTACAAALASMDLMEKDETLKSIERISNRHQSFFEKIKSHKNILSARCIGTILALEIKTSEKSGYMNSLSEKIASWFIKRGIILRPLGNVLYVLPPYCIVNEDLNYIYICIIEFLETEACS
ncbi:MAG TPA: adenosylmethionine--8-amino-7-oxononanoate transaminase [Bacteroidia bacterium]|jgi:adenosylmethionine-8-amino-7-oxononanoate aminotransferase|nr:adenosylmethionine--8-amino-7-oxononanoate transaminase [Bacteroidia bacterium]